MTDILRITGFLMMLIGGVLVASWFIEPLREVWPLLLDLPLPVRIGLGVAGAGLLVGLIVPHLPRRRKRRSGWF